MNDAAALNREGQYSANGRPSNLIPKLTGTGHSRMPCEQHRAGRSSGTIAHVGNRLFGQHLARTTEVLG